MSTTNAFVGPGIVSAVALLALVGAFLTGWLSDEDDGPAGD